MQIRLVGPASLGGMTAITAGLAVQQQARCARRAARQSIRSTVTAGSRPGPGCRQAETAGVCSFTFGCRKLIDMP
jgi:hypothetical protein